MNAILTIFFFFLILGFLVFVHELGHFLAAKLTKVPVESFAIGFGPKLISHKYRGTEYRLNAFPLGGYVQLEGEESQSSPLGFRNRSFGVKFIILIGGVFMNIIFAILFLGIQLNINNYIFPLPNLANHNFTNTQIEEKVFPVGIFELDDRYGWENVPEQRIISINGERFLNPDEFLNLIEENLNSTITAEMINPEGSNVNEIFEEIELIVGGRFNSQFVTLDILEVTEGGNFDGEVEEGVSMIGINGVRFQSEEDFRIQLGQIRFNEENTFEFIDLETEAITTQQILIESVEEGEPILGVRYQYNQGVGIDFGGQSEASYFLRYEENLLSPFAFTYDLTIYQIKAIGSLVSEAFSTNDFSEVANTFGGPIQVGDQIDNVVELELYSALFGFTGLISLSLAIFNILPIPALDGGQIAIFGFESLRGRKISDEVISRINLTGFSFLIVLSILITIKDLVQLNFLEGIGNFIESIFGR